MYKLLRGLIINKSNVLPQIMPFYAVRIGKEPGIYETWKECKQNVDGVTARFKKFKTREEAEAFMKIIDPKDLKRKPFVADSKKKKEQSVEDEESPKKRKKEPENKKIKKQKTEPANDGDREVVYSDGCCLFNGRHGAVAGVGVFWGDGDERNISESLAGNQTNQRAELNGAIRALEAAIQCGLNKIELRTDSAYTINAMTNWMDSWKKRDFKTIKGTDVKNKDDMVKLHKLTQKIDVKWTHVQGHSNIYGNEKADELAKQAAFNSKTKAK